MSHQQRTQSRPPVPQEARAVLPEIANCQRNAFEQLGTAFTEFRPLAILISDVGSASSSVIRDFLDDIGDDVVVVRVTAANSNAIAGMREIIRAIGFDPKGMSVGEMENVFTMFLSYQKSHDHRTIICVDEAPDRGQWVLDRVRHLVKLETVGKYGLMVILSGQSGLNEPLEEHLLNTLATDVAERITIAPPAGDETQQVVQRRSMAENTSEVGEPIQRHTTALMHRLTRVVPDAVKTLYARRLHVAKEEKSDAMTAGAAKKAAKQLQDERMSQSPEVDARTEKENGAGPTIGRLVVHMADEIIQAQLLRQGHILIGRNKMCDLRLVPHEVSRHHAIVVNSPNGTELVDLRSKNGTFVDGRPIKRHPLRDNDAISIGGCMIRYIADDNR